MNEETTSEAGVSFAGKYLTFKLAAEEYGIALLKIREIIGMLPMTHIPRMPRFVKGVVNLRGELIPVIDLGQRFGFSPQEVTLFTCIIVVEVSHAGETFPVGMIVDAVNEVVQFAPANVEPTPVYVGGVNMTFIRGMGKRGGRITILLDSDKVLNPAEIVVITAGP